MRPRPRGLGNWALRKATGFDAPRFNEAEAARPRKLIRSSVIDIVAYVLQ